MTQETKAQNGADGQSIGGGNPPYWTAPSTRSRGPRWRGVIAVAAVGALLSSALTAGVVKAFDDNSSATVTPAAAKQSTPAVVGKAGGPNWVSVAAAVEPTVVAVQVQAADGSGGEGSGVILDQHGRVLTNNHVVAAAGSGGTISVTLADGRIYGASVTGTDPSTDLAVITLKNPPSGLKPSTFGDSAKAAVGDPVMTVGNPLGLSETVTTGIISAVNRPVTTSASTEQQQQSPFAEQQPQTEQVVTNAIQTDAAINPGNSGGALVDSSGRVIGITSSIASLGQQTFGSSDQSGSIGLGFAIPSNEATRVSGQLIAKGTVQHAYLGITLTDGTAVVNGTHREAAVIGSVTNGTPAAKAGLKAKDAITAIDGTPLDGADSLVAQVRALPPGTRINLTLVRGGRQQTVSLTLAARPAVNSE